MTRVDAAVARSAPRRATSARARCAAVGLSAWLGAVVLPAACAPSRGVPANVPHEEAPSAAALRAVDVPGAWPRAWRDPSPHAPHRLDVDGVGLEYLDWGGRGPLLVLLPGLGTNPHVYDELAPRLVDRFRVVAMAPRGVAGSDAPDTGYTLTRVAEDVRALVDRLGADRAVLGAHSLGAVAITHFAARYPRRVRALVYLDASPEDWNGGAAAGVDPVARPPLAPDSATDDDAYRRYMTAFFYGTWTAALEAQLRAYATGYDGERRRFLVKQYAEDAAARPAPLRALREAGAPVLALCAVPAARDRYPWLAPGTAEYRSGQRFVARVLQPAARARCAAFEAQVPTARAVTIPGSHFLFITDPARVAQEIARVVHVPPDTAR